MLINYMFYNFIRQLLSEDSTFDIEVVCLFHLLNSLEGLALLYI